MTVPTSVVDVSANDALEKPDFLVASDFHIPVVTSRELQCMSYFVHSSTNVHFSFKQAP